MAIMGFHRKLHTEGTRSFRDMYGALSAHLDAHKKEAHQQAYLMLILSEMKPFLLKNIMVGVFWHYCISHHKWDQGLWWILCI
jgi:hypothetical protein